MMPGYEFPEWLSAEPNQSELLAQYGGLDGAFDTGALSNAYGQQMAGNTSDYRARGNAMAAAAQTRARRNGGQVAASFAAGSANLAGMRQNGKLLFDQESMKLNAAAQRASLGANIAGQLASGRQNQTGMMSSFYNAGMDRQQQNNQFGRNLAQNESQFGRSLAQGGSQFDQNLAQQGSQFGQDLDYRNRTLAQSSSQFSQNFAAQQQQDQFARLQAALQLMPNIQRQGETTASGAPLNSNNNFRQANIAQAGRNAVQQRMMRYVGI